MNKRQFIWLTIRFIGVFWLIKSLSVILKIPFLGGASFCLLPLPSNSTSENLTFLVLAITLAKQLATVIIILYLLFGGRCIFAIVNRTSRNCHDDLLQREDYAQILIRFLGIWWLFRIVTEICRLLLALAVTLLVKSMTNVPNVSQIDNQDIQELLDSMCSMFLLAHVLDILVYALLAWYFLRGGKLIIRLLRHRWFGKEDAPPD